MMKLLAPVDNIRFDIEEALEKQLYAVSLPFSGMDKSASAVCELFLKSKCDKDMCPFRHVSGDKSVVCKHWLRGLCKKGDECEFLHEYDTSKMPECFFYSKYGQCGNKECEFLHLNRESKIKDCAWYDRGFCRHGPNCKNEHVTKVICQNYLYGFCIDGPNCKFKHPKFELPVADQATQHKKQIFVCDYCHEKGHKMSSCFKLNPELRQSKQPFSQLSNNLNANNQNEIMRSNEDKDVDFDGENEKSESGSISSGMSNNMGVGIGPHRRDMHPGKMPFIRHPNSQQNHHHHFNFHHHHHHGNPHFQSNHHHHHNHHHNQNNNNNNNNNNNGGDNTTRFQTQPKPPSEVTCFKCGEKGHYANRCNKNVLTFLRSNDSN